MSATLDMADDFSILLVVALYMRRKMNHRGRKRVWVRSIFTKRRQKGENHQLLQEMRLTDPESHFTYIRMSKEKFDTLLSKVCDTNYYIIYNTSTYLEH